MKESQLAIKEKLKDYNDLILEISNLEGRIAKLKGKDILIDCVQASSKYFPYTKRNITIENPQPKLLEKKEKLRKILEKRLDKLLENQKEIETFITDLPTSRLRTIFELKYFKQYSYKKIAYILGGNSTENSVRMELNRCFEKK